MTKKATARLAGFTYFILVLTGIFYLAYVPKQFVVWSDAAATADNIMSGELLFRLWVFVGVISNIAYLLLPFVLYRLFESVNRTAALLMVVLSVVSVPFSLSYTIKIGRAHV